MLIAQQDARLLGKIAFMGLWQGRFAESEAIFAALGAAQPHRIGPALGLGMVHAHKGEYAKAAELLETKALAIDPKDDHARAWLGLALYRDGKKDQAKKRLDAVLADGEAKDAKELARAILDEMAAATT
jgi:hypothetical protein